MERKDEFPNLILGRLATLNLSRLRTYSISCTRFAWLLRAELTVMMALESSQCIRWLVFSRERIGVWIVAFLKDLRTNSVKTRGRRG